MASINKYTNTKGTFFEAYEYGIEDPITGKRKRHHKKGFKTKREARAWAEDLRSAERQTGTPLVEIDQKSTYKEIYERWLQGYRNQVAPSTLYKTTRMFEYHILPVFGDKKINAINSIHCQQFVDDLASKFVKYKDMFNYFKGVLHYAIKYDIIQKNPCDKVMVPKPNANHDEEIDEVEPVWTKDELQKFLEACESHEDKMAYPLFRTLAYTGMRRGEALGLRWKNVDLDACQIKVISAITTDKEGTPVVGKPKNKSSIRIISIDQETTDVLREWKTLQSEIIKDILSDDQIVFTKTKDKQLSLSRPRKLMITLCEKAKLRPIKVHGLRHTHCTLLIEAGANIKDVQARLGHSSPETTLKIYAHVHEKRKVTATNIFTEYMAK